MNVNARAWHLANALEALASLATIKDRGVALQEIPFDHAISAPSKNDVTVVALSQGSSVNEEERKAVEGWALADVTDEWHPVDISLRARIIWTPERIAIIGAPDAVDDSCIPAVLVALIAQQAARLENELAALWASLEAHAALTHSVSRTDLARQVEVDKATRRGWQLRAHHAALERKLSQTHGMTAAGRRIFRELVVQVGLQDRIERLDPGIEVVQDLYELATDRLTEYRYFRREYILEALILLVLVLELISLSKEYIF